MQLHPLLMVIGFILVGGEGKQISMYAKFSLFLFFGNLYEIEVIFIFYYQNESFFLNSMKLRKLCQHDTTSCELCQYDMIFVKSK